MAENRVRKWTDVLAGMAQGILTIGSRAPVSGTPAWVTLEVAHGGFATGNYLAAGPLSPYEQERLIRLGHAEAKLARQVLNLSFLTEDGLRELLGMLDTGCYRVVTAEQSALLVVAFLAASDCADEACKLLAIIEPWMDRLTFYPEPSDKPLPLAATVHLESVAQVTSRLSIIVDRVRILAQKEALNIWLPLHDELVRLVVDSCEEPQAERAESLGQPFARCDETWFRRASDLLRRYAELRQVHQLSGKPERRGEIFFELRSLVRKQLESANKASLLESDLKRTRELLRREFAKRGAPNSDLRQKLRNTQAQVGKLPTHAQSAKVVCSRLKQFEPDSGLEHPEFVIDPELNETERAKLFDSSDSKSQHLFSESICKKVMRCLEASVDELVKRGLVTSGDVLARLVPQISSQALAWRFADQRARRLFLQTYQAFRARRSLLLLNLQKQVQFEELPWIHTLSASFPPSYDFRQSPKQTFVDVAILNLRSFPHAIVPNKLLQELRALAKAADLSVDLLDELAADIFMGTFSRKYGDATKLAAAQMQGTLYANYYEINTDEILKANFGSKHVATGLAEICARRAGVKSGSNFFSFETAMGGVVGSPASNGCVIEQQQILSTQNLASLFSIPELSAELQANLREMSEATFDWLLNELALPRTDRHSCLIAVKNGAYAWRQMLYYLSKLPHDEVVEFVDAMELAVSKYRQEFTVRFHPAIVGIRNVLAGRSPEVDGGKKFLGWTTTRHWLLSDSK